MMKATVVLGGFVALLMSACATGKGAAPQIEVSPEAAARSCIIHACGKQPTEAAPEATHRVREDAPAQARALEPADPANPDVELGNPEIRVLLRARAGAPLEILSAADAESAPAPGLRVVVSALVSADGVERPLLTDRVTMFSGEDGSATVTVFGHASTNPLLHATTTLKLARGDRAFLVSSTLENTGPSAADAVDVQDRVTWAGMRPFVPGATRASNIVDAREFTGPYVGGVGAEVSVAYTSTEGEVKATLEKELGRLHLAQALSLGARSQRSFDRVLVVGTRGDSSSVVAELLHASGIATGTVRVNLAPRTQDSQEDMPRAIKGNNVPSHELIVRSGAADVMTVKMHDATLDVELPEGAFTIRSRGEPESAGVPVTIHAGLAASIAVPLAR